MNAWRAQNGAGAGLGQPDRQRHATTGSTFAPARPSSSGRQRLELIGQVFNLLGTDNLGGVGSTLRDQRLVGFLRPHPHGAAAAAGRNRPSVSSGNQRFVISHIEGADHETRHLYPLGYSAGGASAASAQELSRDSSAERRKARRRRQLSARVRTHQDEHDERGRADARSLLSVHARREHAVVRRAHGAHHELAVQHLRRVERRPQPEPGHEQRGLQKQGSGGEDARGLLRVLRRRVFVARPRKACSNT